MSCILSTPQERFTDTYEHTDKEHGRIITRSIRVASVNPSEFRFPHLSQIAIINRTTTKLNSSPMRKPETVGIVTSMNSSQASARELLEYNIDYWTIENKLHYVLDVTFGEDRSRIRTKNAPLIMASLRNLALSIIRLLEVKEVADACRTFAFNPSLALNCLGY